MSTSYSTQLSTILQALQVDGASVKTTHLETVVLHVTADSRTVLEGSVFVAIAGGTQDGHRYIPSAIDSGAVAVIGSLPVKELATVGIAPPVGVPYFVVDDTRYALAVASAALYGNPSREMTVIGVTGTDGKTTTCTLLESILVEATRSVHYPDGRVGVITTVGATILGEEQDTGLHVTTPDAPEVQKYLAKMREAGCLYAIIESTSHGLAQRRVAAVDYNVAAVTNITHEHLDYHGTREAYVQAKAMLFRSLNAEVVDHHVKRFAVLNSDDDGSYDALRHAMEEETASNGVQTPVYIYGIGQNAGRSVDVQAINIAYLPSMTIFDLVWKGEALSIETCLIGEFNVQNILCAATVALGLGIEPEAVQRGVKQMAGIIGRMERIDRGQSFLALVDFAHSPVSLERALHTLRPLVESDGLGNPGRLIAIFGCAGLRDHQKRRLMGSVSARLADYTVITAEDPRTENLADINSEIELGVLEHTTSEQYSIVPDRTDAIRHAVRIAKPGDVVVAFGKGHERSMCFGTTEFPWSDQDAMAQALEWVGYSGVAEAYTT